MKKAFFSILLVIFLCRYGYADSPLADIMSAILKQEYKQAQALAEELLNSNPDEKISHEAQYYLGLCFVRLEQYEEAREIFNNLIKEKPIASLHDKAYLGIFDTHYLDGRYQNAFDIGKKLLKASPKSELISLIYLKMARASLKLAKWRTARRYLKLIVIKFPKSLEAHAAKQLLEEKQYFAVQVGSFMDRALAERLTFELKQKQEYAYIVETIDQQNRKFYRVRVGQLALLDEAQKLKSELSKQGYPTQIYP